MLDENTSLVPAATQLAPPELYVRCEEKPDYAGKYVIVPEREINGYPFWVKEDGTRWLLSSARNSRSRDPGNLKWSLTKKAEHLDRAHEITKGNICTCIHNGRLPWEMIHMDWKSNRHRSEQCWTGTVVSRSPNPELPEWAEKLWKLRKTSSAMIYVNQRDVFMQEVQVVSNAFTSCLLSTTYAVAAAEIKFKAIEAKLQSCVSACMKACFPDVRLRIGFETVWANRDFLSSVSPFFAAMFAKESVMQEAATGQVDLPTADIAVVRSLLSLLYTSGAALGELALPLPVFIDVLAQAAEWECRDLVKKLLAELKPRISSADAETASRMLKLVSVHAGVSRLSGWSKLLEAAIERFAETRNGNLEALLELPVEVLTQVLACDGLDTGDNEAAVLRCVVEWSQRHGMSELPSLLEFVRFPFIRFSTLSREEREALARANFCAADQVQQLIGEATSLQIQRCAKEPCDHRGQKRRMKDAAGSEPSLFAAVDSDGSDEETLSDEEEHTEGRMRKRRKCSGIPSLPPQDLGKVLINSLCAS